jgi:hypothetical protein
MNAEPCRSLSKRARGPICAVLAVVAAAAVAGCAGTQRTGAARPGGEYAFWPPPPNEPRVQYLTSYSFSSDVEPPQSGFDKLVFGTDRAVLPIGKPYGVAFWQGRIYVCDIVNPAVVILDLVERQTRLMLSRRGEPMRQPTDIAIAPDGMKYVVDRRVGRIFVFDAEDRHVYTFGQPGLVPVGVAVHGEELFVPDLESQSVLVLDRSRGNHLRTIGESGGGPGQFISPLGVEVDGHGDVYVTDAIRGRLQKFDPDGGLVYALGEISDAPGNFVRPKHVAVDPDGIIFVVDAAFQNVQMFNADGQLLMFFGSPGFHLGSMSLPAGVTVHEGDLGLFEEYVHPAFEPRRLLLVTNQFGLHKVAVYALGRLKEGATVDDITPVAVTVTTDRGEGGGAADLLLQQEVAPPEAPRQAPQAPPDADDG